MNMNQDPSCRRFELLLSDMLDGNLSPAEQQQADQHLAVCPDCRELLQLVQDNTAILSFENDEGLTAAILSGTSGLACERAEELLCDHADGLLPAGESNLLEQHLSHCKQCRTLAADLIWLSRILPEMAELEPDPAFTGEVLARTSEMVSPLTGALTRLGAWWQGVVHRPGFALEGAYIGILIIVGLFGTPISPMRDATPRALELVKAGPGGLASALAPELDYITDFARRRGQVIWNCSGARIGHRITTMGDDLDARRQRIAPGLSSLNQHGDKLGEALQDLDFVLSVAQIREIQNDITRIRRQWRTDSSTEETIETGHQSGGK